MHDQRRKVFSNSSSRSNIHEENDEDSERRGSKKLWGSFLAILDKLCLGCFWKGSTSSMLPSATLRKQAGLYRDQSSTFNELLFLWNVEHEMFHKLEASKGHWKHLERSSSVKSRLSQD